MSDHGLVLLTLVVVAALADATHALPVDARVNVYVTCDGGDVVGTHLCFAVKEGAFEALQKVPGAPKELSKAVSVGSPPLGPCL